MKHSIAEEKFKEIHAKRARFKTLFASPNGQEVLKALEAEFDHVNIKSSDPHETYYRLGQRDVVVYLRQILQAGETNE